jgi:hypothetical protein
MIFDIVVESGNVQENSLGAGGPVKVGKSKLIQANPTFEMRSQGTKERKK